MIEGLDAIPTGVNFWYTPKHGGRRVIVTLTAEEIVRLKKLLNQAVDTNSAVQEKA